MVYLLTLVREPDWGDPAELLLQAFRLGVTHPPGAPLHTLLVGLAMRLGGDPALTGNVISALASAAAAAFVAIAVHGLTRKLRPSVIAAWLFAFLHPIWTMAVVTELYALSACLLGLTMVFLLRDKPRAAGIAFALALGAYRPNALLIVPAAFWASRTETRTPRTRLQSFLVPAVGGGLAWVLWDVLRSRTVPPLGAEFVPDHWAGIVRFLTAAQYTAHPPTDASFYIGRLVDHGVRMGKYFLGIGLIAAFVGWWRLPKRLIPPVTLWLVVALAYFTFHPYQDYFLMPHAAYLVLAVLGGCGFAALDSALSKQQPAVRLAGRVGMLFIPLLLIAIQYGRFRERAQRQEVTAFATQTFAVLPRDAVVFSRWERFTTLRYFQDVRGVRPDLLVLERQEHVRRYGQLTVPGWRAMARAEMVNGRAVFVDGPWTPELNEPPNAVVLAPLSTGTNARSPWMRVVRVP